MKPKVYIFSIFNWNSGLLHREHMLSLAFSRLGYEVCFVERSHRKPFGSPIRREGKIDILTVFAGPYFRGFFRNIFRINDWLLSRQVSKNMSDNESAWLILSSPLWTKVALSMKSRKDRTIYDMSDNHLAFTTNKRWFKNLQRYESLLLERADEVFLSSSNLSKKVPGKTKCKIFNNGVDLKKFSEANPILKDKYKGKVVGFVGGVYERVDLSLVEACAAALPDVNFVVVGPNDRASDLKKLEYLRNFYYLGAKPWQEIQDYFASFDIGIIPFVSESEYPWLKTVDSVKIYQYAYFGYPIVTTQFGQIQKMGEIIKVAKNKTEFVSLVKAAIYQEEKPEIKGKRKELARKHDWTKIANEMANEIENISS